MEKQYNSLQELFADPSRWTKDAYARDAKGNECNNDESASSWCVLGGFWKVYGNGHERRQKVNKLRDYLQDKYTTHPAQWNDFHAAQWNDFHVTHEELLRVCKELDI